MVFQEVPQYLSLQIEGRGFSEDCLEELQTSQLSPACHCLFLLQCAKLTVSNLEP